jgi:hypothetical protein
MYVIDLFKKMDLKENCPLYQLEALCLQVKEEEEVKEAEAAANKEEEEKERKRRWH